MKSIWFVSRQCYWGVEEDEANVVEIALGGLDYANADMLCEKYEGEGEEYRDPREAIKAALKIAEQWKKDQSDLTIGVAHGCTGGMTMPFEASEVEELQKWADEQYEKLPKCDQCGELIETKYTLAEDDVEFCSEYCAEQYQAETQTEEEEVA